MAVYKDAAKQIASRVFRDFTEEELVRALSPRSSVTDPLPPRVPRMGFAGPEAVGERRSMLREQGRSLGALKPHFPIEDTSYLRGNIEGYVGDLCVPVGIMGPLRVNGLNAHGDYYVPMATTEGALVASYQRGATLISKCGGARVMCLTERVVRAPAFQFETMIEASRFLVWVIAHFEKLKEEAATTTRHGRLEEMRSNLHGNTAYLMFEYTTGDASGQNMVTFATRAVCEYILAHCPMRPRRWYLESNMSGDKKATASSFMYLRGKKVVAECILTAKTLQRYLHTTAESVHRYWQVSFQGGVLSGSIGVQGHFANGLAAVFLACGQDVACTAEAAVGTTQMSITDEGALYVSVSLPNLIVGTVGGGTRLPTQASCLELLGCRGTGKARSFAEIVAAVVLAGEVSLMGAIAAGEFDSAHRKYGRRG